MDTEMCDVVEISATDSKASKKSKIRFSVADDIQLLREVAAHERPFKHGSKAWEKIAENLTGRLDGAKERTLRERAISLVKRHKQGQATSLKQ